MMGNVATEPIPPFERFYLGYRDEVLGYLRRLLGQRAEDAWQETSCERSAPTTGSSTGDTFAPGCSRSRRMWRWTTCA